MAAIMKSLCIAFTILAFSAALFSAADARRFNVGGNGIWVMNPQENYKTWAERNRFQVNDTLYFKYAKGSDSVQQVTKADFDGCNVKNPLKDFDNGESEVTFDRSGPFYFITGNEDHCRKGQKLIVVVLAVRNHTTIPISPAKPPSTANPPNSPSPVSPIAPAKPPKSSSPVSPISPVKPPSPAQSPKSPSPVKSPSPAQSPKSPSPGSPITPAQPPKFPSPVSPISPAKPPSTAQPPKSSSPVSPISPAKPPSTARPPKSPSPASPSHSPAKSPTIPSPSPKSPSPASVPSPSNPPKSSTSPDQAPIIPAPEQTPATSSPSPSEINPTAPAPSPKRNAASGVAVNSVMTTVVSVALTLMMFA